jgi:hypothetical protein
MKAEKYINVNPAVLKWARVTLDMNKTRAAELLEISLHQLEQLESGNKQPIIDILKYRKILIKYLHYH